MALARKLQELEERLLRSHVRADAEQVAALLCDEFREYGASGSMFTKEEIIAVLKTEAPSQLSLQNFACEIVTEDVALVTYRSTRQIEDRKVESLRSSLWVRRQGDWQMLFHQGTRVATESAPALGKTD